MTNQGPVGAHAVLGDDNGPSDLELVQRTRDGDSRAFGELWNRHSRAGRTVARSYALDADDVVAESFAKVLQAIKGGGGPTAAFRPYLFSTIRNVAMQWRKASIVDASDELDALADPSSEDSETLLALDKSLTAQAFRSLPTRWQEALWYSEVEQLSSQEISPLLGMTPNAVSALTFRAREGLRQAWIQAHLVRSADTECAAIIDKLGSYTRGSLGPRESRRVETHLAACPSCTIVDEEARDIGSRLALVMLPLAAGIAGALAYTVWLQGGSAASAATLDAASGGASTAGESGHAAKALQPLSSHSANGQLSFRDPGGGEHASSKTKTPEHAPSAVHTTANVSAIMPSTGVLAGIGLAVAAAIGAAFVLGPFFGHTQPSPVIEAAAARSNAERQLDPNSLYGSAKSEAVGKGVGTGAQNGPATQDPAGTAITAPPAGSTSGSANPSSGRGGTAGSFPRSSGPSTPNTANQGTQTGSGAQAAAPAQADTAAPPATTPTAPVTTPPPSPPPTSPPPSSPPPTTPPPSAPPTAPPTSPPPTSTPPTAPPATTPPTSEPPSTPQALFTLDDNNLVYPTLSGTAAPGARVEVVDQTATGADVVAQTVADSSGAFGVTDFSQVGFGTHRLAVRQLSGNGVSSAETSTTPVTLDDIDIRSPLNESTLGDPSFIMAVSGDADALFEVLVDGASAATGMLNADGNSSLQLRLPSTTEPKQFTLGVRYFDPSTGRFGPTRSVTVTFDPSA